MTNLHKIQRFGGCKGSEVKSSAHEIWKQINKQNHNNIYVIEVVWSSMTIVWLCMTWTFDFPHCLQLTKMHANQQEKLRKYLSCISQAGSLVSRVPTNYCQLSSNCSSASASFRNQVKLTTTHRNTHGNYSTCLNRISLNWTSPCRVASLLLLTRSFGLLPRFVSESNAFRSLQCQLHGLRLLQGGSLIILEWVYSASRLRKDINQNFPSETNARK